MPELAPPLRPPPSKPRWDQLTFQRWQGKRPKPHPGMTNEGWDTETKKGRAFIMASSREWRRVESLEDCLRFLTQPRYRGVRGCWWNIDYDVTAMMKHDHDAMADLLLDGACLYGRWRLTYVRHKVLSIRTHDGKVHKHYDASQFYRASLKAAALRYLGREAPEIKEHRHELWRYPDEEVGEYCRWDATATKDLADLYSDKLAKVGLQPRHLISSGHLWQTLQLTEGGIPTWRHNPSGVNRLAWEAQRGAWIDVHARGECDVWKYDIKSAYPHYLRGMPDLAHGQWVRDPDPREARVGFVRCQVRDPTTDLPTILSTNVKPSNVYPRLDEPATAVLTLDEYRFLRRVGATLRPDLWCSFIPDDPEARPWDRLLGRLDKIKQANKGDPGAYLAAKELINSSYGKTAERIEKDDGTWEAGRIFNPVAAACTLAGTRVKVAEACLGRTGDVVAVATDCVAATRPIHGLDHTGEVGSWEVEHEGKRGLFLQPGIYEIDGVRPHTRGFAVNAVDSLWDVVKQGGDSFTITMERPHTGRESARRGRPEDANVFRKVEYRITPANHRRIWDEPVTDFSQLRGNLIRSQPVPWSLILEAAP